MSCNSETSKYSPPKGTHPLRNRNKSLNSANSQWKSKIPSKAPSWGQEQGNHRKLVRGPRIQRMLRQSSALDLSLQYLRNALKYALLERQRLSLSSSLSLTLLKKKKKKRKEKNLLLVQSKRKHCGSQEDKSFWHQRRGCLSWTSGHAGQAPGKVASLFWKERPSDSRQHRVRSRSSCESGSPW